MQEHIFERMARERNISVEEMRAIISDRIEKGWNDKDPVKREQWRKIPCAGEIPTPDEWLSYVIKKIKDTSDCSESPAHAGAWLTARRWGQGTRRRDWFPDTPCCWNSISRL